MTSSVLSVRTTQRSREDEHSGFVRVSGLPVEDAVDPEQAADELLGRYVTSAVTDGIYTQIQLDRKMRDERKRLPSIPEQGVADEVVDYLVERQIEELIEVAGLSAMQEIVYRLHIGGLDQRQISVALGVKRRTIEERLRSVKRKVRAAYTEGKFAGWYEVYLSEVNRPAYRGRQ